MSDVASVNDANQPEFCPWCGTPVPYRSDSHTPLYRTLADEHQVEPPDVVEDSLHTDAFVCGCPGCRRISHVIAHPPAH